MHQETGDGFFYKFGLCFFLRIYFKGFCEVFNSVFTFRSMNCGWNVRGASFLETRGLIVSAMSWLFSTLTRLRYFLRLKGVLWVIQCYSIQPPLLSHISLGYSYSQQGDEV